MSAGSTPIRNAAGENIQDSMMQVVINLALSDEYSSIKRTAIDIIKATKNESYKHKYYSIITSLANSDKDNLVKASAIGLLSIWKDTANKNLFLNSIYDSSYTVAGAALEGLQKIDSQTAYTKAIKLIGTNPKGALESTIWTIIGKAGKDEDIIVYKIFENKLSSAMSRYAYLYSLNNYLKIVKNDSSFSKGIDMYIAGLNGIGAKNLRTRFGTILFSLADNLKNKLKNSSINDVETIQKRITILKSELKNMIDAETEASAKETYNKKMKEFFDE